MIIDNKLLISIVKVQEKFKLCSFSRNNLSDVDQKLVVFCTSSNSKINIVILANTATNVVTIVGIASYTSGLHEWKGAALTLNKNPTDIITKEKPI